MCTESKCDFSPPPRRDARGVEGPTHPRVSNTAL